jgi:CrcB protein
VTEDQGSSARPGVFDVDVDLHPVARRRASWHGEASLLATIAAGGALGALGRYGVGMWLAGPPDGFPWATLWVNVTGCFLMGVLMVGITEVWSPHRLLRPFLGTGVLGGYTTFSAYTGEAHHLLTHGRVPLAFGYLAVTLVAALVAVYAGLALTRLGMRVHPAIRGSTR